MNRIFKVIWSKAKQCRVVVSEIAKSCTSVSKSHKRLLAASVLSLILFSGINNVSYAGVFVSGTSNRNNFDLSQLSTSQQSAIKNGLFLGTSGTYDTNSSGGITSHPLNFPFIDDSEGSGEHYLLDYYLVYDSSNKAFEVVSLLASPTGTRNDSRYSHYNVLYTVPNETAESLGLSVPSSTQDKEFKNNVIVDKNLNVSGNAETKGNQTVNGTSDLKGDVTADSNVTVGKDLTVSGTTNLQNTNVAGNLDVQGDTTLKNTKVDGTFETTGNAAFDGDTETKGNAVIGKNLTVSGATDLKGDLLAEGNAIMNQNMTVKGSASVFKDFSVSGNTTLVGDTNIGKSLSVSGPATFKNDVHMDKNLSVDGNITTSGVISASDAIIGGKSINSTLNNLGSAMDAKIDSVSHRLNQNINKAAAGAAALAALHPQDFDPDDKWDFAAGMGHYHDANSAALGVYYHPNEDTLVSLGSTMGNGDPMMNLGLSIKLGHGSGKTLSRAEMSKMLKTDREAMKVMVKNMIEMKKEIEALKANKVDSLKVSEISDKKTFPDVPTGHWANQAVTTLHDNHVVQGYPDGNFKGDRTMTRYEYAEMLYNALKRGLPVPQKQIDEYEAELKKIAESRNESLPVSKITKNTQKGDTAKSVERAASLKK
mgnify:CR=1 FL=1